MGPYSWVGYNTVSRVLCCHSATLYCQTTSLLCTRGYEPYTTAPDVCELEWN